MIIKDEKLLQEFREACVCEWCGKEVRTGCDPAHLFARGLGGGHRLDVRCNLAALCRPCHVRHHNGGRPTRDDLVSVVSRREGLTEDELAESVWRLARKR